MNKAYYSAVIEKRIQRQMRREFPYPDFGAVRVQVWLPQPMDIDAVGTIAQCRQPDIFWFRQTLKDIAFIAD